MVEVRNGCYPSDAADWTGSQPGWLNAMPSGMQPYVNQWLYGPQVATVLLPRGWQEAPDVTRIYIVAALLPDVAGPIRVPRFAARTTRPAARR